MKKKRNYYAKKNTNTKKYGLFIFLILAIALVGIQFFGNMQFTGFETEPPHVIHKASIESFSAPYYGWTVPSYVNPTGKPRYWEKSNHIEKSISFDNIINWSNVYKVSTTVNGRTSGDSGAAELILWYNPTCSRIYNIDGRIYQSYCGWNDYAISDSFRDDTLSVRSVTNIWNAETPITSMAFGAYNADRYNYISVNSLSVSVYEEVECTENIHCVTVAPICNVNTNICEKEILPPVIDLCGNGICDAGEQTSCSQDCIITTQPPTLCGNGVKDVGETIFTCPKDYISPTWLIIIILIVSMIIYYLNIKK